MGPTEFSGWRKEIPWSRKAKFRRIKLYPDTSSKIIGITNVLVKFMAPADIQHTFGFHRPEIVVAAIDAMP
ncbi:MAG: hypothetical protein LBS68_00885 [Puniceicoccales bacterium]|jgi:hypothetical protein|nr:hypothetical protein [Puniceicoccales bacterium]